MAAAASSDAGLGPLIRMRALKIDELPVHPELSSQQSSAPDLNSFVSAALKEANTFVTKYWSSKFSVKDTNKQSPPSTASVKLFTHEIKATDLTKELQGAGCGDETWFARTSVHDNEAKSGTASWQEFDNGLRVDHSQHEKDYTPDVYDAHKALDWSTELEARGRKVGGWEDVHVSIMEMAHHIPAPLNNRVFPVVVITAKKTEEFLVVQIPVATKGLPNAKYHNVPKVTGGMYCSIERGKLLDEGAKVQWQMATASDAKGVLPMWAQKMGVPGAVVKDVGLFIGWCAKKRKGEA